MTNQPTKENRARRKKTPVEVPLWEYIETYAKSWVFTDMPKSWSTSISAYLDYNPGWLASLRNRKTSVNVSTIYDVCKTLNALRPPIAPKITISTAFLGAERLMSSGRTSVICVDLPLVDQIILSRKAKQYGLTLNEYAKQQLMEETRAEILK